MAALGSNKQFLGANAIARQGRSVRGVSAYMKPSSGINIAYMGRKTSDSEDVPDPFVVLAENDLDDAFLFRHGFVKAAPTLAIRVMPDGEAARMFFSRWLEDPVEQLPSLVFLDIKMPKLNGLDVLQWMRSHEAFDKVPVVMLSSSQATSDIMRAKELKAQGYYSKFLRDLDLPALLAAAESFAEKGPAGFALPRNLLLKV